MPKDLSKALLFDLYGPLLSQRQKDIFECYYFDDLSLAEIAENYGITRQAALNSIKKAETRLSQIENELKFNEKYRLYIALLDKISDLAQGILEGEDSQENAQLIISVVNSVNKD